MIDFLLRPWRCNFGPDKEFYRAIDGLFGFVPHNIERLEYLGYAVIEAVTSDYLYIEFPDRDEGFMTKLRSKIVSRQSLNAIARQIGLDRYVILDGSSNTLAQKHIFGDAFEAMMGAIYLDQGYNFVNRLLKWCQKNHHTIRFRTTRQENSAANHPLFRSTALIDNMEVGHGSGESKKEA